MRSSSSSLHVTFCKLRSRRSLAHILFQALSCSEVSANELKLNFWKLPWLLPTRRASASTLSPEKCTGSSVLFEQQILFFFCGQRMSARLCCACGHNKAVLRRAATGNLVCTYMHPPKDSGIEACAFDAFCLIASMLTCRYRETRAHHPASVLPVRAVLPRVLLRGL